MAFVSLGQFCYDRVMSLPLPPSSSYAVCPSDKYEEAARVLGQGFHPADLWLSPDFTKPLTVADVRQVISFAHRSPVGVSKLVVLHGAESFRLEVANALLKILEEPPASVSLVLLASRNSLLPTIKSRVRHLAGPVDFATMKSAWHTLLAGYDLGQPAQRQAALDALYRAPLLHAGIKEASLLEPLTQQQRLL